RFGQRRIVIEDESNVRDAIGDRKAIQAFAHFAIQVSRLALINSCGIKETICNHARAAFNRRLYCLAYELTTTGLKEKQLGFGGHAGIMRSKLQKLANRFTNKPTDRLAR